MHNYQFLALKLKQSTFYLFSIIANTSLQKNLKKNIYGKCSQVYFEALFISILLYDKLLRRIFVQRKLNTTSNDSKLSLYVDIKYMIKTLESLSVRGIALSEDSVTEDLLCHASINLLIMLVRSPLLCQKSTPSIV